VIELYTFILMTNPPIDPNDPQIHPLWLLVILGPLGSLAGCAALLRTGKDLDKRSFFSSILNSGLMAVVICAFIFYYYGTSNVWLPIALSILSGLGGIDLINFTLALAMKVMKTLVDSKTDQP